MNIVACLGGNLPAVDAKSLLEFLNRSLRRYFSLVLQIYLIASHHDYYVVNV